MNPPFTYEPKKCRVVSGAAQAGKHEQRSAARRRLRGSDDPGHSGRLAELARLVAFVSMWVNGEMEIAHRGRVK
ncbi:hypothetical protein [Nonomuraea fuscirosea]|uniref:hypothetical protein n=1 Tax=Nonomuraea fuscirosea TaxID=1291556 RepID=UPI003420032F